MKHYYKSSGLQMFFTGAAIAVMFIIYHRSCFRTKRR